MRSNRRRRRAGSSSVVRAAAEGLEGRLLLAAGAVTAGAVTTALLNGSGGDDLIELSVSGGNVIGKLNNVVVFNVADTSIDEVIINAGGGVDSIFVDHTGNNNVTVTGEAGNDILHLAELNKVVAGNILGAVSFDGGSESNSLVIHDESQTLARTNNFGSANYSQNGSFTMSWFDVAGVTVNGGSGADTVNLPNPSYNQTFNGGDGADTFNVGGSTVGFVTGNLTLNGGNGADTLTYNDASNALASTYTLTSSTVTRGGSALVTYSGLSQLNLNTGNLTGKTINILSTANGTGCVVNAGPAADVINVGDAASVEQIQGAVTVHGGGGSDELRYQDAANGFDDTYMLSSFTIQRSFSAQVTYDQTEIVKVDAGTNANTIDVLSTNGSTTYNVYAGPGADTINVGEDDTVEQIDGAVTIDGSLGADTVNYNDSANGFGDTYSATNNSITRDFSAVVTIATSVETVNVNAGSSGNTINVTATAPLGPAWTIDAGDGADTLSILGSGANDNVAFAPTTITTNGTINHSDAEAFSFNSGGGTDSLTINSVTVELLATAKLSSLSTTSGGTLDLLENDLIITAMPYSSVELLVKFGFGNFDWLGHGITSSSAAAFAQIDGSRAVGVIDNADWGHGTFGGQTVGSTDILVKFTWVADSNLDGLVDNDDFGQFLYGFNGGGAPRWLNGDFDLNGIVDNDDFGWFLTGLAAFNASGNMQL